MSQDKMLKAVEEVHQHVHNDTTCYTCMLEYACIDHIKKDLKYILMAVPENLEGQPFAFDGAHLIYVCHKNSVQDEYHYLYAPMHIFLREPMHDYYGVPLPLLVWRGIIWNPIARRYMSESAPEPGEWIVIEDAYAILKEFLESFELVFDEDWDYTQLNLGVDAQEPRTSIAPKGTFLRPGVHDESNNWGNRGTLLAGYRQVRAMLDEIEKKREPAYGVL